MKSIVHAAWVLLVLLLLGNAVHAGTPECPPANNDWLAGTLQWHESWKSFKKGLQDKTGTSIGLCLDYHVQAVLNGPGEGRERGLFWWNLTIEQRLWKNAKLVVKARGSTSDDREPPNGVVPLVGSQLNLDWSAYETTCLYVANVYVEQKLLDDKLTLAAGKLTFASFFDTNKVAGWDFLSHSLARCQTFPHRYHTIGALVRCDPLDWLYVQAGITDPQGIRSEMGTNTAFHDEDYTLSMYELGVSPKIHGRQGNYRLHMCYDPQPMIRHDGKGVERDNIVWGANLDQMLTEKAGVFFRYTWNDGRVKTFGHYWSLGGTWTGLIPRRDRDVLGFGLGQGITSPDYRSAHAAAASETIFEAYYKINVTEWCSILLNVETLLNPGANASNDVSVIPGARLKLSF